MNDVKCPYEYKYGKETDNIFSVIIVIIGRIA